MRNACGFGEDKYPRFYGLLLLPLPLLLILLILLFLLLLLLLGRGAGGVGGFLTRSLEGDHPFSLRIIMSLLPPAGIALPPPHRQADRQIDRRPHQSGSNRRPSHGHDNGLTIISQKV